MAQKRKSYWELLRSPQWQRRRLDRLEAAAFECESCGSKDRELHVHHLIYRRGKKPWEYADDELAVLCSDCHEDASLEDVVLNECINKCRDWGGYKLTIAGMAAGFSLLTHLFDDEPGDYSVGIPTIEFAEGVGMFWSLSGEQVLACSDGPHHDVDLARIMNAGGQPPPDYRKTVRNAKK